MTDYISIAQYKVTMTDCLCKINFTKMYPLVTINTSLSLGRAKGLVNFH